jgi:hypothetical protein
LIVVEHCLRSRYTVGACNLSPSGPIVEAASGCRQADAGQWRVSSGYCFTPRPTDWKSASTGRGPIVEVAGGCR